MEPEGLTLVAGQIFVIKIGGEAIADPGVVDGILEDLSILQGAGARIVLMHGGGPQATRLAQRLGLTPRMVGGRRVTDGETLEVMKMTLGGQVGIDVLARCRKHGIRAVGVSGVASDVVQAVKRPPRVVSGSDGEAVDFGHVGDIVAIGTDLLQHLLEGGYMPVVNSLGADEQGAVYNINADIAATRMAMALSADRLFMLTGAPGVLADPEDMDSLFSVLRISAAKEAIASGQIRGGMIPKLEESFVALNAGVKAIHVLSAKAEHGLLRELSEDQRTGTRIEAG
jgi:acetylglutamate kinase